MADQEGTQSPPRSRFQRLRTLLSTESFWVAVALALRVAFAMKLGGRQVQIDEGLVDLEAWTRVSALGHLVIPKPGPELFNACIYAVFGYDRVFPRLGQALVSTATAWMIGRMTADLSGSPRAGKLALAVAAVYPFFIYYSGMLMSETLYLAFLVPGLWWLCMSLGDGGRAGWRAPAAGSALALAAFARAEGAPIVLAIWAAALAFCWRSRWPWRSWVLAVLCWALPLAGWSFYLKAATGESSPDKHGGLTLLIGTMFLDENERDTGLAYEALRHAPFYEEAQRLGEQDRDVFYYRKSFEFMRENWREVPAQWARKSLNFWRFRPRSDKVFLTAGGTDPSAGVPRWALAAMSLGFEPGLILLGFVGLGRLVVRRPALLPLPIFILGTMAVHVVVVSQMRYRLPVMPLLILGACVLLSEIQGLRKA